MKRACLGFLIFATAAIGALAPARAALEWEQIGPDGGDLFGIEVSPGDPDTLYALSYKAVFRSGDAGANWQHIHIPDMGHGFVSLVFDPLDADHIFLASATKGVWESFDRGDGWAACGEGLPTHPDNPSVLNPVASLAALPDGRLFAGLAGTEYLPDPPAWIYRSDGGCGAWVPDDAGISIDTPSSTQETTALLSLDADGRLWAMVHGGGVYLSKNRVWLAVNGDLPPEALRATYLAHDPADASRLLLGSERDWVYESLDSGQSWAALGLPDELLGLATLPLVYNIAVDPNNGALLYVMAIDASVSKETPLFFAHPQEQPEGIGGYLSADGGGQWLKSPVFQRVRIDPGETVSSVLPPFGPVTRSRTWYAATFGIDNLRRSDDGALTFEVLNTGITSLQINAVWLHPNPPAPHFRMLFAAAEAGLALRTDDSPDWARQVPVPDFLFTWSHAADPLDPERVYYATGNPARAFTAQRGVYRIGLDCFGEGCPPGEQLLADTGVWRVVTTPLRPSTIYAATQEEGVLVSEDRGGNWSELNAGLSLPRSITDIALDAAGLPLLAAARANNGDFDLDPPQHWHLSKTELGAIYRFEAGQWQAVPGMTAAVYDLEAHPLDPQRFLAAAADGIHESLDGGLTWQLLLADTLISDLAIDPAPPHYIYAATRDGVLRSTDGGVQWHDLPEGLWQREVHRLVVDAPTGTLYAGTAAGSVFQLPLDSNPRPVLGVEPANLAFAVTPVGFAEEASLTLVNRGEANLGVTGIVSGDPAFELVDLALPIVLTPGGRSDLTVRFQPQSAGPLASQLAIHSNDPMTPVFGFAVSGEGRDAVAPIPDVRLDGLDGPVSVAHGGTIAVTLDLTAGDHFAQDADFWVRWTRADGAQLWLSGESGWVESPTPQRFVSSPITDRRVLSVGLPGLLSGAHQIYFGLDDNADGAFDGTWSDSASFTVGPAPPKIHAVPGSLGFGPTPVGLSGTMAFGIANLGEEDLVVTAIDMGAAEFTFVDPPAFPISIAATESASLTLRFSPQSTGPVASQLTIHSNDPDSPSFDFPVNGSGQAAVPPTPNVKLNGQDGPIVVQNGTLVSLALELAAGDYLGQQADYWVRWARPDGTLHWLVQNSGWVESASPLPFVSNPIVNQPIATVNIAPTVLDAHTLFFAVDDNADGVFDGTWSDAASFTVGPAPPKIHAVPGSLGFGPTPVGLSGTMAFGIVNLGEEDLVVTAIDMGAAEFSLVDPPAFPLSIASGLPETLTLRFSPGSLGPVNSQITIQSNDPLSPAFDIAVGGDGQSAVAPTPDVKLDGLDGPVTIAKGATVGLTLDLDAGDYFGEQTDYWVRWIRPDGSVHWLVQGTGWVESQSPLRFLGSVIADMRLLSFNLAGSQSGTHEFYFAVDDTRDGIFDDTWSDSASFTVEEAPPQLLAVPGDLTFAATVVGYSRTLSFAIVNTGEAELVVDAIDMGAIEFELFDPPAFPLSAAPGVPIVVKVRFTPRTVGPVASQLTIHSNDPAAPAFDIPLSGEGS